MVIVDVSPAASAGFVLARRLRALPGPPAVVLTSSAAPARVGARLDGHSFVAKACLCAQALSEAVPSPGGRRARH